MSHSIRPIHQDICFRVVPLCLLLVTAGCDSCPANVGQISGTVVYKGKELKSDTDVTWNVVFVTEDGTKFPKAVGRSGKYSLDNVPTGPVKIAIIGAPRVPAALAGKSPPLLDAERESQLKRVNNKYADANKSPLTHIVVKGSQRKDIELND